MSEPEKSTEDRSRRFCEDEESSKQFLKALLEKHAAEEKRAEEEKQSKPKE